VAGPRWRHAMGTASWIPRRPQREWRDLMRRRRQLIQTASAEKTGWARWWRTPREAVGSVLSDLA